VASTMCLMPEIYLRCPGCASDGKPLTISSTTLWSEDLLSLTDEYF